MDDKKNLDQENNDNSLNLSASTPQGNSSLPNMAKLKLNIKRPEIIDKKVEENSPLPEKEEKMPVPKLQLKKENPPLVVSTVEPKAEEHPKPIPTIPHDKKVELPKLKTNEDESVLVDEMELPIPEHVDFSKTQKIKSVKEIPLQKVPNLKNLKTGTQESDKKEVMTESETSPSASILDDDFEHQLEEDAGFIPEKKSKKNIIILGIAVIILIILIYFVLVSVGTLLNY